VLRVLVRVAVRDSCVVVHDSCVAVRIACVTVHRVYVAVRVLCVTVCVAVRVAGVSACCSA